MATNEKYITGIPFAGFYESFLSRELDNMEEQEAEYKAEQDIENEEVFPLDASDYADIFWRVSEHQKGFDYLAKKYVKSFNSVFQSEFDINLNLEFESMTSPKEYNFTTDRIFCYIPADIMQAVFDKVSVSYLSKVIRERFTSRDGFISFYSNDIDQWLEKELSEYDHNELETVLIAFMLQHSHEVDCDDEFQFQVFENMTDNSDFYNAFYELVDWVKFDSMVADKRQEKEQEE